MQDITKMNTTCSNKFTFEPSEKQIQKIDTVLLRLYGFVEPTQYKCARYKKISNKEVSKTLVKLHQTILAKFYDPVLKLTRMFYTLYIAQLTKQIHSSVGILSTPQTTEYISNILAQTKHTHIQNANLLLVQYKLSIEN